MSDISTGDTFIFQHCKPESKDPLNGHKVIITKVLNGPFTHIVSGGVDMYEFTSLTDPTRSGDAYADELHPVVGSDE